MRQRRRIVRLLAEDILDVDIVGAVAVEMGLDWDIELAWTVPRRPRIRLPKRDVSDGTGCVYVLSASNGLYKVGSSRRLDSRLSSLQTGSSEPLTIIHTINTTGYTHRATETALHRRLADKRVSGEWFRLSDADIVAIKAL